jgi:hypothetical protein
MEEFGVLVMECLLLQELAPAEHVLNDGKPEDLIIDEYHHVLTAHKLFPDREIVWLCNVADVHSDHLIAINAEKMNILTNFICLEYPHICRG